MAMVHSICKLLLKFPLTTGHIAVTSFSSSLIWPTRRRALSILSFNKAKHAMSWKESRERVRGIMAIFSAEFSTPATSADDKAIDGREYLMMSKEQLLRQCEMNTFKSSGPGGQHRNKRESAVRLKHRPTGIVAQVYHTPYLLKSLRIFNEICWFYLVRFGFIWSCIEKVGLCVFYNYPSLV
ncbi:unnamed protein product [Cuscuta epithymum]|uniref:Prokaryotic-type class I peptide chain release factors domain-containing protein n=1 Tax=Cuscuta epithymum TaxID=186058 RepID=A0AAV0CBA6_9ASTE|nr:unnamed protein product [Cuscuta epithymum]